MRELIDKSNPDTVMHTVSKYSKIATGTPRIQCVQVCLPADQILRLELSK